jgi:hypothetical protein
MLFEASSSLHVWFVPPDPAPVQSSNGATGGGPRNGRKPVGASATSRLPESRQ